jgi:hypothetical protein
MGGPAIRLSAGALFLGGGALTASWQICNTLELIWARSVVRLDLGAIPHEVLIRHG